MIPSLTFDSKTFSQVCLRLDASFKPNTLFTYTISLTRQSMMLPLRHGLSLLTDLRNLGMEVLSVESERPKCHFSVFHTLSTVLIITSVIIRYSRWGYFVVYNLRCNPRKSFETSGNVDKWNYIRHLISWGKSPDYRSSSFSRLISWSGMQYVRVSLTKFAHWGG